MINLFGATPILCIVLIFVLKKRRERKKEIERGREREREREREEEEEGMYAAFPIMLSLPLLSVLSRIYLAHLSA